MNPEEAAKIEEESGAKKLTLIHFDVLIYKTLPEKEEAQKKARGIFKNTFAAMDDMEIEVVPKV